MVARGDVTTGCHIFREQREKRGKNRLKTWKIGVNRLSENLAETPQLLGFTGVNKKTRDKSGFNILVARGGIEPPTQGFSILCSTD